MVQETTEIKDDFSKLQKKEKKQEQLQSKVVVRHLPPSMTEEQFIEQVSPIPDYNFMYYAKADMSLGPFAFCRAYVNFIHQEDIFIFKDKFDGYVFVDLKGNEYPASVEFAPFQKIPRRRVGLNGLPVAADKRDAKCGTIEQDPDYIKFVESLQQSKQEANLPSAEIYLEEIEARDKELKANHGCPKVTTPLIEFIKQKKAERIRLREERREERKKQQELRRQREEEKRQKERFQNIKIKEKKDKDKEKEKEKVNDKPGEKEKNKSEKSKEVEKKDFEREKEKVKKEKDKSKYDYNAKKSFAKHDEKEKHSSETPTFTVKVFQNSERNKFCDNKSKSTGDENEAKSVDREENQCDSRDLRKSESAKHDDRYDDHRAADGRRVRNKDRPALEIYRPAARRFPPSSSSENKDRYEGSSGSHRDGHRYDQKSDRSVRITKVFTRSKHAD